MEKKNIQPQQQKPVVRQNVAQSATEGLSEEQLTAGWSGVISRNLTPSQGPCYFIAQCPPFAGDDAE